ncbi:MAG: BrnT family toxin [Pyrinomonadaceae bacterium]
MRFEWDSVKDAENLKKHGVEMADGIPVFSDPLALDRFDADHSDDEQRFNIIGFGHHELLFVTYTVRGNDVLRLISVRLADAQEKGWYYEE